MRILEKASLLLGDEGESKASSLWHILGPLFILFAYALAPNDPLIFAVGVFGLFLSAKWQVRGLVYALVLLGLASAAEHLFFASNHLVQLGLEASYAIAFFITALNSEQRASALQSLSSQIEAKAASIGHLEEELGRLREETASERIAFAEKSAALLKEIEEERGERSTLSILNEVLRKTAAKDAHERDEAQEALLDVHRRMALLQEESESTEKELARVKNESALAIENRTLTAEINAARLEKEQARLISETLAKLHAKETLKTKEQSERLAQALEEARASTDKYNALRHEADILNNHLEQIGAERDAHRILAQKFEEVSTERNFLRDRLAKAELDLSARKDSPIPHEEAAHLREKIEQLRSFEALYKQLRIQFEERNKVLHEARSQLFKTDTELQMLRMEKEQKELLVSPLSEEMRADLTLLEEEIETLELENQELQDLVTYLSGNPTETAPRRKKKVKTDPDQEFLF